MSNILVVHAHPEPKSFCTALATAAVEEFEARGDTVVVSDLYAQKFNPVASSDDFRSRANPDYLVYSLEQRNAQEHTSLGGDIKTEVDRVLAADTIVFVFPMFWFSTPAILKGWIDRVFLSGTFYGGKRIYGRASMRGKKAVAAVTLGGREHMFGVDALHGELARGMMRHFFQGTLGYVGFDVIEPFFGYHVPYCSNDDRAGILENWRDHLRSLDRKPVMNMPDLSRFDDVFRPLEA
ncbi:NAD(P)H oxidoreductase YRKL putative NADPH-quinone reductase Flavodoxin 2 [Paraburkholderia caribensis MBA4]|uniref:NAD(P)H oxidoreductase YRKL putative NADPH-quinone reductase Flavodoxin 2 n=1 Tax=Paraburkholderia caribensis MBA4 TaxID=1323664 RepID=A0A0N7JV69_9BURK|nr:NAD(P)H-dependent oxidoreductase [Paraburkholderia caribensis]ALL68381.1 NAD(P)H oxidoreductase YRKL putative NADPH-quinone reductase Flavodoxin 2 [Paraburkholderia caribensis MBA4]